MDSHSREGQAEAERKSIIGYGYIIVWRDGGMQLSTFASNRRKCWNLFCREAEREHWRARGARCVPARIVAEYPES